MLQMYKHERQMFMNHEWIYDVKLEDIIESVKTFVNMLSIESKTSADVDKYNEMC